MTLAPATLPAFNAILVSRTAIDPSPNNPRKRFDEAALRELAASMAPPVGMLQPLVVRLGKKAGRFELVAGERRWRAAGLIDMDQVPVVVRDLSDELVLEIQIIENEKRKDIHALEQSDALVAWTRLNPSLTGKLIAERIGMSERYVLNLLHYQKLIPAVREAFYADRITAGHADLIVRLKPEEQSKALAACFEQVYVQLEDASGTLFEDEEVTGKGKAANVTRTASVRKLDEWIKGNIRLDVKVADPDTLLPELREALQPTPIAGAESVKGVPTLVEVADTWDFYGKNWKGPTPLTRREWREVNGKKCEFAKRAVVVLGPRRGRLVDICTATGQCKAHWSETIRVATQARSSKSAKPAKKSASDLKREREQQERRQQAELWDVVKPQALKLAESAIAKVKLSVTLKMIGDELRESLFIATIPKQPNLQDLMRAVVQHHADDTFSFNVGVAKPLGLDLKPLFAAAAAPKTKTAKPAAPKKRAAKKPTAKKPATRKPTRKAGAKK